MPSWLKSLQRNASEALAEVQRPPASSHPHTSTPPVHQSQQHVIDSSRGTPENATVFQSFEWHTPSDPSSPNDTHSPRSHYARLTRLLPSLANLGITTIWLPPGCKANSPQGNGYDCYDLWDLGEFDQKWTRSTKWGSREELADLLKKAHTHNVECIFDAVLNHKTAGDATEETWAVEVDPEDRRLEICEPKKIEAWLRYEFPGRRQAGMKYSGMQWDQSSFNGTDWDQRGNRNAIFKLIDDPATSPKPVQHSPAMMSGGMNRLARFADKQSGTTSTAQTRRPGKGWAEDVDDQHGNFDYLLFSNIDYTNLNVRQDVLNWGEWMIRDIGVDGFRLDAVQHYSFAFCREWISRIQSASLAKRGRSALIVGEVWTGQVKRILQWLDSVGQDAYAYDSCLVYNFSRISEDVRTGSKNADLRTMLRDCLTAIRPGQSMTLVTNHDTQIGQSSYTPIMPELKVLFYAFVLLRAEGLPCVFWGDLYGTKGKHAEPPACLRQDDRRSLLADLVMCRKFFSYGAQTDYFDAQSCIGWTRAGTGDRPGCAVVMSIAKKHALKKMSVGKAGEIWVDLLGQISSKKGVQIDEDGCGNFGCSSGNVSVYVNAKELERVDWNANFDVDNVYGST